MKKIASIALALTIAAAALPAVVSSAEEGPSPTFRVGGNRGDWSVEGKDYTRYTAPGAPNFGLYVLGNALDGEVTLSADLVVGNEYGFMFGITDCNGDQSIAETGDQYYLVDLRTNGYVGIERNDKKWDESIGDKGWIAVTEAVAANAGETVTLSATYKKTADKVTISVSANGKEVLNYEDTAPFVGVAYGLASKSDKPMKNVSAPDLPDSAMSLDLIADVEANNPKIAYKAGSAVSVTEKSGDIRGASSMEEALEHLFDDVNDAETSRFCVVYGANKTVTVTWETAKSEVATYLIIYGGPNVLKNNRSIASFVLSGSTDGEHWEQIASVGRVHLRQADSVGGVHLNNAKAYDHYKIDMVKTEGDEIESLGIHLYAANPTVDPGTGENPGGGSENPGGSGENPGGETPPPTGSASIVIAAVATIALAGVVVAARKREQD